MCVCIDRETVNMWCRTVALLSFGMVNGVLQGGFKRRLEEALKRAEAEAEIALTSGAPASASSSSSSSTTMPLRGGIRRRVEVASQHAPPPNDLPLIDSLKRHWAKGTITSPMVQ